MPDTTRHSAWLKSIRKVLLTLTVFFLGVAVAHVFLWPHGNDKPSAWLFTNTPHLIYSKVASGPVALTPGENHYWTIAINPIAMPKAHVVGTFQTSGGSENDIQVVLAEASEFEKWQNGREAKTLYFGDQITSGKFDVRLPAAGTYVLSLRNTSPTVSKNTSAEVFLRYLAAPAR